MKSRKREDDRVWAGGGGGRGRASDVLVSKKKKKKNSWESGRTEAGVTSVTGDKKPK